MATLENLRTTNPKLAVLREFIRDSVGVLVVKTIYDIRLGVPVRNGKIIRLADAMSYGSDGLYQRLVKTIGGSMIISENKEPIVSKSGIRIPNMESWTLSHRSELSLIFENKTEGKTIGFYISAKTK